MKIIHACNVALDQLVNEAALWALPFVIGGRKASFSWNSTHLRSSCRGRAWQLTKPFCYRFANDALSVARSRGSGGISDK